MIRDFKNEKGNVGGVFNFNVDTIDGYRDATKNDRLQEKTKISTDKYVWKTEEKLFKPALDQTIDLLEETIEYLGLDKDKCFNLKKIEISKLLSLPDSFIQDFHLDYSRKNYLNLIFNYFCFFN